MKILQINAVNAIGSTGRSCTEMVDTLTKSGHVCYNLYSSGKSSINAICVSQKWECKYHAFMSRLTGLQGYFSYFSTGKIIRIIEEKQPDIVHLQNLHANYVNLNRLLKYLAKHDIATVVTLHDCWFFTGKCTHYTEQKCYKWQTGCSQCPKLKMDNKSWLFDRTSKMWKDKKEGFERIPRLAVVGVSDWLTNEAKQSFLSSAKIIKRIYNWIDLSVFKPVDTETKRKELGLENKFIILGVASGWSNKKGLDVFLELAKQLSEEEIIILVGNLNTDLLPKNIMHINATNNIQELVEYYSMADIFLQMSLEETFGKVVAEALACGTPVITVDSTANGELVNDNCGVVLEKKNAVQIINAIRQIKGNGKSRYCSVCRKFAKENFNMNDLISEYMDVYKRLLGRESGHKQ